MKLNSVYLLNVFLMSLHLCANASPTFQDSDNADPFDSAKYYWEQGQWWTAKMKLEGLLKSNGVARSAVSHHYLLLADIEEFEGRYVLALRHYRQSLKSEKVNSHIKSRALAGIANALVAIGKYDSVQFYINESLKSDSTVQNQWINEMTWGKYWQSQNSDDLALGYFQRAYDKAKSSSDRKWMGIGLTSLGRIYFNHDVTKAIEYYNKAIDVWDSVRHVDLVAWNYARLANCYMVLDDAKRADDYLKRAKRITDVTGHLAIRSYVLSSIGILVSEAEGNRKGGLAYMEQSVQIRKALGQEKQMENDLYNLSEGYLALGQHDKARQKLEEGIAIARKFNDMVYLHYFYEGSALLDSAVGNYKGAYVNFKRAMIFKDSVAERRKRKEVALLTAKFENIEKEERISLLEKEQALVRAEASRNAWQRNSILIISFLLTGTTIFFIRHYRQRWRQSDILRQHEVTALLSEHRIEQAKAQIAGQLKERQRIARDLHDGVGGTLAGLQLALESNQYDHSKILGRIKNIYEEVRSISHDLMHSKSTAFVAGLRESMKELSDLTRIDISVKCYPEEVIDKQDEGKLFHVLRIIQEVVNNAVKYSGSSSIDIELIKYDESLHLEVEDKGKGFEKRNTGNGIGLETIQHRVEELGGTVHIDSRSGKGTIVSIDIPDTVTFL